jgi:hypothetical protein
MRSFWLRASAAIGATALVLSALGIAAAPPAAADSKETITLHPNEKIVRTFDAPILPGAAYEEVNGFTPSDCETGAPTALMCDEYKIRLLDTDGKPLSAARLNATGSLFTLSIKLDWKSDEFDIPSFGNVPVQGLGMTLWDDPIVKDDDTPAACNPDDPIVNFYLCQVLGPAGGQPGGDEAWFDSGAIAQPPPANFGLTPKRNAYQLSVFNDLALPIKPTLTIELIETKADLTDLSVDTPGSVTDSSATPAAPAIPSLPDLGGAAPAVPGFDLSPAAIGDTQLDSLTAGAPSLDLGPDAASIIQGRAIRALGKPKPASAPLLWLWLVGFPAVLAAGVAYWFLRRRSAFSAI